MGGLLEVRHIKKYFPVKSGILRRTKYYLKPVDDISFSIQTGEIFGLVGESGCGKSTLGKVVLRLLEPTEGEISFRGERINHLPQEEMRVLRKDMQIIFQDPLASLNPRMTIYKILQRPMRTYGLVDTKHQREEVSSLLDKVGLKEEYLDRYPHELSGGQQQRIGIARALSLRPQFLVLDEPTSSLDVSIQLQIINLLMQLQNELKLSYLFISHNLSLCRVPPPVSSIFPKVADFGPDATTPKEFVNQKRNCLRSLPIIMWPAIFTERLHLRRLTSQQTPTTYLGWLD